MLWEIADCPIFRAKNVAADELQLRVPVWVSGLCFPDASSSKVAATANRHGQVRLYDARTQSRRPVQEAKFEEQTLTCVASTPKEYQVLVGSTTGQLGLFDLRQDRRGLFRKYKGCVGSVRSVACAADTGYFGAVGLDRFLRVYHVDRKDMVNHSYLKSRLNCVLVRDDFDPTKSEEERAKDAQEEQESKVDKVGIDDDEEEDDEAFWNSVGASVKADKKRSVDDTPSIKKKKRKVKN